MERTPGYRTTASSSGVTTPSTSLGGMSGLVPPQPGISIWGTSLWETPITQQPVTTLSYRPPIGRSKRLKATLGMRAPVPQVLQIAPAICTTPPLPRGQPVTPFQQVVQLPSRTSGIRVTFDSSATKPTPTGSRDIMYVGDRLAEAKMMTVSLPATPGEDRKGPPSGRPVTRCLDRRVDAPPGRLIISLHPPPLETPRHSLVALRGLPLETL